MELDPQVARLINANIDANASIRARVTDFITRVWNSLPEYRDANIESFVNQVLPIVMGAQRQVGSLTDAYLALVLSNMTGEPIRPLGINPRDVTGEALRGVAPSTVYGRGGTEVWTALSKGTPFEQARDQGLKRVINIAMTDLQLAKTHTARKVFQQSEHVVGHRRVLSGSENCGLCYVASTQRYHKSNLQPIHPGCDCGVAPILGHDDPGQVIDESQLNDTHVAIEERFGTSSDDARSALDYRKVLLIKEHGEIGPVLTVKGQHFDGPSSIPS